MKLETKFLIGILIIAIIVVAGLFGIKLAKGMQGSQTSASGQQVVEEGKQDEVPVKEINIFKGGERPIAIMIDNHDDARPQAGLNDAYVVYEMVVEGGYTRLMPIFKGVDVDKIGPVRSARHYFIDYALENDAIYTHFGWSPQAETDISKLKVNNINGIQQSSSDFKRDKGKYAPHDVVTSIDKIQKIAEAKKYRTTSNEESVFEYSADEINLESGETADEVYIPFSKSQNVGFKYDAQNKVYVKYANKKKQTDWASKKDITSKNIIITFVEYYTLNDKENKGRQGINNTKKLDGYYITNGKAIKITCEKSSRTEKTIYRDLEGNEIKVNDGNTYVGLCELDTKVEIEGNEEVKTGTGNNV